MTAVKYDDVEDIKNGLDAINASICDGKLAKIGTVLIIQLNEGKTTTDLDISSNTSSHDKMYGHKVAKDIECFVDRKIKGPLGRISKHIFGHQKHNTVQAIVMKISYKDDKCVKIAYKQSHKGYEFSFDTTHITGSPALVVARNFDFFLRHAGPNCYKDLGESTTEGLFNHRNPAALGMAMIAYQHAVIAAQTRLQMGEKQSLNIGTAKRLLAESQALYEN